MEKTAESATDIPVGHEHECDDGPQVDDEQLDTLRIASLKLANILYDPKVNSALKRNETRQQALDALVRCIDAMATMCTSARDNVLAVAQAFDVEAALLAAKAEEKKGA